MLRDISHLTVMHSSNYDISQKIRIREEGHVFAVVEDINLWQSNIHKLH
jgi:hypothetical protein